MKKVLLLGCFILAAVFAKAATTQTLTINGQTVNKVVTQITFSGDNAVLTFSDGEETYDMSLVRLAFDTSTGINSVETFEFQGLVDGELNISGLSGGTNLMVFDTTGKLMGSLKAQQSTAKMSLDGLKSGVYILKAGNKVVKFVKH